MSQDDSIGAKPVAALALPKELVHSCHQPSTLPVVAAKVAVAIPFETETDGVPVMLAGTVAE